MKYVEKILVGIDFEGPLEAVKHRAACLAKRFNAELIPVHAVAHMPFFSDPTPLRKMYDELYSRMAVICQEFYDQGIQVTEPVMDICKARELILETAEREDVNLVIIGGKKQSTAKGFFLGRTAENVVKESSRPVMVVHADEAAEISKILCPYDYSPAAHQALESAIHLASLYDAELHICHVIHLPHDFPYIPLYEIPMTTMRVPVEDDPQAILDYEKEQLDKNLEPYDFSKLKNYKSVLLDGDVEEELLSYMGYEKIDLVVMGAVGRGSVMQHFIGNTATHILRDAPCSVITVKDKDIFRVEHEFAPVQGHYDDIDASPELQVYLKKHLSEAEKLMSESFTDDAVKEYRECIKKNPFCYEAYDALIKHFQDAGDSVSSHRYMQEKENARRREASHKIEAEVRQHRPIFKHRENES